MMFSENLFPLKKIKINLNKTNSVNQKNSYILFKCACAKLCLDDYKAAVADYSAMIKTNKKHLESYIYRAYSKYFLKQYRDSLLDCNKALKIDYSNKLIYLIKHLCYLRLGNIKLATKNYELADNQSINHLEALKYSIRRYAIEYFNELIKTNINDYKYYFYCGIALLGNNCYKKALKNFEQTVEIKADFAQGYSFIGWTKYLLQNSVIEEKIKNSKNIINIIEIKELKDVYKYFDKALSLNTALTEAYFYRANINSKKYEEGNAIDCKSAINDFKKCILLDSQNAHKYYLLMSDCYDDDDKKIEIYKQIIKIAPNTKEAYTAHYGIITCEEKYLEKDDEQIIERYESILKLYKNKQIDLDNTIPIDFKEPFIAETYYKLGQYHKCINIIQDLNFDIVISFDKNKLFHLLIDAQINIQDYKNAIKTCKKYILKLPEIFNPINNIEKTEKEQQKIYKSIAYLKIGNCEKYSNDNKKADKYYTKAINTNYKLQDAYYNRAIIKTKLKQYYKAISDYNECEKNYKNMIQKYSQSKNNNEVYYQIKKIKARLNNLYFNRGNIYYTLSNYNAAISNYTEALNLNSEDQNSLLNRYRAYKILKKLNEANSDLSKLILFGYKIDWS